MPRACVEVKIGRLESTESAVRAGGQAVEEQTEEEEEGAEASV
jgi:hypothetical protein